MKDAFDQWQEWERRDDPSGTLPADIYEAVMALQPDERHDREKVNQAVRDGLHRGPLQPAGSADEPRAEE